MLKVYLVFIHKIPGMLKTKILCDQKSKQIIVNQHLNFLCQIIWGEIPLKIKNSGFI